MRSHLALLALAFVVTSCGTTDRTSVTSQPVARPEATTTVPSQEAAPVEGPLFDGKTLKGWQPTDFAGKGEVSVDKGQINIGSGYMTGITWTNPFPRMNYELSLYAKRVDGSDFFCGLTFPIETNFCSFIVGGWGGGVVGLSSLDGEDASQNETTKYLNFVNDRWYHIRLRVVPGKIQGWIDNEEVFDVETEDRRFSIRLEVEPSRPLGIATWNTAAAIRDIQLKRL